MFNKKQFSYAADGGAGAGAGTGGAGDAGAAAAAAAAAAGGAAGTGGAGSGGAGAAGGTTPPPTTPAWDSSFSPELKGFIEAKGYKKPEDVYDSYRALEKHMGASPDKLIKLADGWDKDPAIQGEIFQKLGKPLKADGYNIALPAEGSSKEMADWAKNAFYDANLTQAQAEKVSAKWNEYQKSQQDALTAATQTQIQGEIDGLKKEWGAAYDQNHKQAQAAAREFGVKAEVVDKLQNALGFSETMKLFQKIGAKIGEDKFHTGGSASGGSMTPDGAKAQLKMYTADSAFMAKYHKGDAEAKAIMNKIHESIAAGAV